MAAAQRSRAALEARHRMLADADLVAGVTEIGRRALRGSSPMDAASAGDRMADGADAWRFAVLDRAEPEVFLFADRSLFVSRGALVALTGETMLEELVERAAEIFAGGSFRSGPENSLVEQPLRVALPRPGQAALGTGPGGAAAPSRSRERWLDLLDGLPFGDPPEFGVADGRQLLLPAADLLLVLPEGDRFEAVSRGAFTASRGGEPTGLTVRERPISGMPSFPAGGDLAREREFQRHLATRLAAAGQGRHQEFALAEVFRVRGFVGVRGRLYGLSGRRAGSGPDLPVPAGRPEGLIAFLATPGALVEIGLDCAGRTFERCEEYLVALLKSAERRWNAPLPGPLRLAAWPVADGGPAREAIGRLACAGRSEVPRRVLFTLNRGWLDEALNAGDRVIIVRRDRPAEESPAGPPARLPEQIC